MPQKENLYSNKFFHFVLSYSMSYKTKVIVLWLYTEEINQNIQSVFKWNSFVRHADESVRYQLEVDTLR